MVYQVSQILQDVRTAIDENRRDEPLMAESDDDTLSLDAIIRSKIAEAVRKVELAAPTYLLGEGHNFNAEPFWQDKGVGFVLLPDDFMRMTAFRMSDWERPCYQAISATDPIYKLQHSRCAGLRGNTQLPIVAIVNRPEGKALEFYSCKDNTATVAIATYVPYPYIDRYDGIDFGERLYEAVIYTTASLVYATYSNAEKAELMTALAKAILES